MNEITFGRELNNIAELTEEQVREKLEFLVNTPMTYEGYRLAYYGMFSLMHKCGADKQDKRFREAVYKKVIKMLESEPEPGDSTAIHRQIDYATALLSHFLKPPVPKEYASQLKEAALKYYSRGVREGDFKGMFDRL
ncbi:hypothetical protein HZC30_00125 [Candidatus Woesearchaeota archaeon]|nr:hypothetical protein [Candidatus Woesearchaeota archaeon]